MDNVFYSWQSDAPRDINHHFIKSCLKGATANIAKSTGRVLTVRDGVRGESGTVPVAETILRRIAVAQVYVADISLVYAASGGDEHRRSPNPNVAFEFGYAMAELTGTRVIGVLNEHFGTADKLPFDLQHLRWPLKYHLSPDSSKKERIECKRLLVRQLETAIYDVLATEGAPRTLVQRRSQVDNELTLLIERNNALKLAFQRHTSAGFRRQGVAVSLRIASAALELRNALAAATSIHEMNQISEFSADMMRMIAGGAQQVEEVALQRDAIHKSMLKLARLADAKPHERRFKEQRDAVIAEILTLDEIFAWDGKTRFIDLLRAEER